MTVKWALSLSFLIIVCCDISGARKHSRRNRQIQNGPTSYVFFEMIKFQKKEPYLHSVRYPVFKGTPDFKTDILNNFFKEKIDKEWKCDPEVEAGKYVLNSKILYFNPKFTSMKIIVESECKASEKLSLEKSVNFSLASGKIFTLRDFVDEDKDSSFKTSYVEKITEGASEDCKVVFKEKADKMDFDFFITKDQILVKMNLPDIPHSCDLYADFSFSEIKHYRADGSPFQVF